MYLIQISAAVDLFPRSWCRKLIGISQYLTQTNWLETRNKLEITATQKSCIQTGADLSTILTFTFLSAKLSLPLSWLHDLHRTCMAGRGIYILTGGDVPSYLGNVRVQYRFPMLFRCLVSFNGGSCHKLEWVGTTSTQQKKVKEGGGSFSWVTMKFFSILKRQDAVRANIQYKMRTRIWCGHNAGWWSGVVE